MAEQVTLRQEVDRLQQALPSGSVFSPQVAATVAKIKELVATQLSDFVVDSKLHMDVTRTVQIITQPGIVDRLLSFLFMVLFGAFETNESEVSELSLQLDPKQKRLRAQLEKIRELDILLNETQTRLETNDSEVFRSQDMRPLRPEELENHRIFIAETLAGMGLGATVEIRMIPVPTKEEVTSYLSKARAEIRRLLA